MSTEDLIERIQAVTDLTGLKEALIEELRAQDADANRNIESVREREVYMSCLASASLIWTAYRSRLSSVLKRYEEKHTSVVER